MHYIYCYTNKINNHKYVGQTNNYERRIREHRSCSFDENAFSYNHLIHRKIRQYGEENFKIELLEILYTDDLNLVNEREQYWIKEKNSYVGDGEGYNMDHGGGNKEHLRVLTEDKISELKEEIKKGIPYIDLQERFGVSPSYISSVNHGVYYHDDDCEYPLYKYFKDNSDYDELIDLLLNSTLSLADIARQLGLGYSTVKKINAGTLRAGIYPTYPIRVKSASEQRADKIKEILMTAPQYSNKEIAYMVGASEETVRRTDKGLVYNDPLLSYPLRKPVTTIPG